MTTSVSLLDRPAPARPPKMVHLVRSSVPKVALCGAAVTQLEPLATAPDCIVCAELNQ